LCDCRGKVSGGLPLGEVSRFLEQRWPGLRVVLGDRLCEPGVLARLVSEQGVKPAVIGACPELRSKLISWAETEDSFAEVCSMSVVDVVGQVSLPGSRSELAERVKLLLWSRARRQSKFGGVPGESVKAQFSRPQGKMSRRELFEMLVPRYQVVPYIQRQRCAGAATCRICREVCPFGAIVIDGTAVSVDRLACRGCGACVAVCPYEAVVYPTFSLDQLESELEGLLVEMGTLEPRIVAVTCRGGMCSPGDAAGSIGREDPLNVLPLEVPCLSMVSCWLLLRAFDMGAQGVALVAASDGCQFDGASARWLREVELARRLLERWGIEPGRIEVLDWDDSSGSVKRFAQEIRGLGPTRLREYRPAAVVDEGPALAGLVLSLDTRLGASQVGSVPCGRMQAGYVIVDGTQCTACGLCASDCPTGALRWVAEGDSWSLLFDHALCVGCGQCVEVCPEGCLKLDNVIAPDKLGGPAEVVFGTGMVKCRECGAAVAPEAMVGRLRSKLAAAHGQTWQLEICGACKLKIRSGREAGVSGA